MGVCAGAAGGIVMTGEREGGRDLPFLREVKRDLTAAREQCVRRGLLHTTKWWVWGCGLPVWPAWGVQDVARLVAPRLPLCLVHECSQLISFKAQRSAYLVQLSLECKDRQPGIKFKQQPTLTLDAVQPELLHIT